MKLNGTIKYLLKEYKKMWSVGIAVPFLAGISPFIYCIFTSFSHPPFAIGMTGIMGVVFLGFASKYDKQKIALLKTLEQIEICLGGGSFLYSSFIFNYRLQYDYKDEEIKWSFDTQPLCESCKTLLQYRVENTISYLKCDVCGTSKQLNCSGYDFGQSAQRAFEVKLEQCENVNKLSKSK